MTPPPGMRLVRRPDGTVEAEQTDAYAKAVARAARSDDLMREAEALASRVLALRELAAISPYLDDVLAATLKRVRAALEERPDTAAARVLLWALVREAAKERKATGQTPEQAADRVVERSTRAGVVLIPFAAKLPAARKELVAAIECWGRRGDQIAEGKMLALQRRLGLGSGSPSAVHAARSRRRKA